jgi:hypothetical protein
MTHPPRFLVLDDEARRFLKRTGVRVVAIEVVVLAAIWLFQSWFGR